MDARRILFVVGLSLTLGQFVVAQRYRAESTNFVVVAPDASLARKAAELAEQYRKDLSNDWLGYEIPKWREKCPVEIQIGPHAGGETSFAFVNSGKQSRGEPISWRMKIYGPPDRLLDAVLPHEVTHTIFATHFGQPLPRWADEGACTTVEHESERAKNHRMLINFLTGAPSRGIPFNRMFTMKQYPRDILPLYAQGYSVAKYLIAQKGRKHFVKFLEYGMSNERCSYDTKTWDNATKQYYGYDDLSDLQVSWIQWVREGSNTDLLAAEIVSNSSPLVDPNATYAVAKNQDQLPNPQSTDIARGDDTGSKLNSWYARESRAKTAIDGEANLSKRNHRPSFLPGSVKRTRPGNELFPDLPTRDSKNSSAEHGRTIWR